MRHPVLFCTTAALSLSLAAISLTHAQTKPAATSPTTATKPAKQLLIPSRIDKVPAGNDFNNPDSTYSFKHSRTSDNFVLFWDKEYGDDPKSNTGQRHFDPDELIKEADRFYNYYIDTLKWIDKDKSIGVKYKFLFFVISNSSGGTAYGGSIENQIGAFWSPASRVAKGPYGVVAHELGHSFQAMNRADGAAGFSGPNIGEMTSQFMLWQVYPEWLTFENYHLTAYMQATNLAFLHPDNQYHTCHVFEYWAEKHGAEIIGQMWREVRRGEDAVMCYKRLTKQSQEQFDDEIFEAERHFVTWDMPRIEKAAARYSDQHTTVINKVADSDGWFQIADNKVPQEYGYNAIKLKVPAAASTKITLDFKGVAGTANFSKTNLDSAGWRYGFLAHKADGTRVYSDVFKQSTGKSEFTVPADTRFLWLVVTGTPTEHTIFSAGRGGAGAGAGGRGGRGGRGAATTPATATAPAAANNGPAQFPYQFKLTGTDPDNSIIR